MGDRSSRKKKEAAKTTTDGRWRSSCRRCGKKRRKPDNAFSDDQRQQEKELPMAAASDNQEVISTSDSMAKTVINIKMQDPCNPLSYFLNRQIDGKVNYCKKLVDERFSNAQNLFRKDLYSHYGCVNAIEFSKEGDLLVSGGDDKRVLLWNVEKAIQEHGEPTVMRAQHLSNIFCLGYNSSKTKIFSAGNDDQVIVHDLQTTEVLNFFSHEKPVYGLSVHPHNDNVFSSACDDGRVLIYDIRESCSSPESFFCVAQHKNPFQSVMFSPIEPSLLATANVKEGVSMWDVRKPLIPVLRYGSEGGAQSCMNVRFNQAGNILLAIRRRLPPVLYAVDSATHLCQFDHPGYYNSCTMKSCCFAGNNDEYILSGSDDFNLYMWKIPTDDTIKWVDSAHMILRGHRSIVNQVRYNQASCVLASSGVEKIIKLWSPFPLSSKYSGGLRRDDDKEEKQRRVYTHDEYIGLVLRSGQFMTHDYSHQSIDEDQRMMAFFDSLVQREIETWSSEDVPTPQSPSDPENNNVSDRNNPSDSEDSTVSEHQLVRCILGSSLNSHSANTPERPLESPNRITRLIANRREKLMRLAAIESSSQSKNNASSSTTTTTGNPSTTTINVNGVDSASGSEPENNKSKANKIITLKSKGVKRKHSSRTSTRRNRARRKINNAKDDSDTEPDCECLSPTHKHLHKNNNTSRAIIDAAQPSTSSGFVSSRRSRYQTTALAVEPQRRQSCSSSSSSEDNNAKATTSNASKRRSTKTDSDSSRERPMKEPPKRKASRNKSKLSSTFNHSRREHRVKGKRQKVNNDNECNNHNSKKNSVVHNGVTAKEATPAKNSKLPTTSTDSGITSGVSTTEKNTTTEKSSSRGRAESSDREIIKNLEWFRKKVDMARRSYRKRITVPTPSSSDSSDD